MPVIALVTDFGIQDAYVGVMKGVIAGVCPEALVIDVTHAITPQDIREGAWALLTSFAYFPPGTVFVVIVDPGVGGARQPLAVTAGQYIFVGPDNGVLSYAMRRVGSYHAYALTSPAHRLPAVSNTFHGRDIFAPAAAHLAHGEQLSALGAQVERINMLPDPFLEIEPDRISGEIIHIDRYGNAVTSIGVLEWRNNGTLTLEPIFGSVLERRTIDAAVASTSVGDIELTGILQHYSLAERDANLALVGSSGFLEIAVNQGNAATQLSLGIGSRVELKIG